MATEPLIAAALACVLLGIVFGLVIGRRGAAREIAHRIRAELVCCNIYDRDAGTDRAGETHAICFWGEAAARLAERRRADDDAD